MQLAPTWRPANLHSALTEERLRAIAQIIWDRATKVAQIAEPEQGDTGWGIGCRRYEWWKKALSEAAVGELVEFLSVAPRSSHFLIKVDLVPIRLYRGNPHKQAPKRYASPSPLEAQQMEIAFGSEYADVGPLRLVVETDARHMPVQICFARVSPSGELTDITPIPVNQGAASKVMPLVKTEPKVSVTPLSLADAAARSRRRPRLEGQEGASSA
ncbi:hypothetical protein [Gemmatimonas sp.]|uniref:hypothetical protein n=1 Tax=Gemmatimonas sp. TaxID=1962908 RepID=UPI003F6F4329